MSNELATWMAHFCRISDLPSNVTQTISAADSLYPMWDLENGVRDLPLNSPVKPEIIFQDWFEEIYGMGLVSKAEYNEVVYRVTIAFAMARTRQIL